MLFQLMEVVASSAPSSADVEVVEQQQVTLQQEVASVCEEKATTPVVIPTGEPLAKVTTVVPGTKVTTIEVCEAGPDSAFEGA